MNYHQLTEEERYQSYILMKAEHNQNAIAALLGHSPSTISRELKRYRGLRGYRSAQAQRFSNNRRTTAHKAIKVTNEVRSWIEKLLRQELSPQQVADYLLRHKQVSLHHKTIYQIVYSDKVEGGDLYKHLRVLSKPYRKRYGHYDRRGQIKNR